MVLKNIHKDPGFYISLLFGALTGIWSYGYWLAGLFPLGSNRLLAVVFLVFLAAAVLFYFLMRRLILPVVDKLTRTGKIWFWIACSLLGLFLYFSIANFSYLQSRYIYLLLPQQQLEIRAEQNNLTGGKDVTLQGFSTAIGEVGYGELQLKGWQRDKADSRQISLETLDGNQILWKGQAGNQAVLLFEQSPAGGRVDVTWNGKQKSYDLYAPVNGTLKLTQAFVVPVFAGWLSLALIMMVGFIAGICVLFALMLTAKVEIKEPQTGRFDWLWFALPMVVVWVFYLLVFFPGG